jgi:vacuolar-type H+-ATPase subunit I/STV1
MRISPADFPAIWWRDYYCFFINKGRADFRNKDMPYAYIYHVFTFVVSCSAAVFSYNRVILLSMTHSILRSVVI